MVSPINSLANMEYMLYGGASGVNPNCPSFSNGYMANNTSWNYQTPFGYNNQSIWNNQYDQNYGLGNVGGASTTSDAQQASQTGFGASSRDIDTLGKYYLKGMEPSESLLGAAGGGAAFALVNNTRFIAHPFASLSSLGAVEKMFAGVKDKKSALGKLWNNPETNAVVRDAYHKMHKLEGASKWRFAPLFKKRLDKTTYDALKKEMETALKSGNKEQIAKVTEKIRIATGSKTGVIPQAWRSLIGKTNPDIAKMTTDTAVKSAVDKKLAEKAVSGYGEAIKKGFKSQGIKGGGFFAAMEFLMDFGKIRTAFSKDSSTGVKQLGQTSVKAAGSIIGWTVGEAVGAAAGAKIGAAVGTAFCPGLGTAIGAVAGLVGGSIGTWAMGKLTKKLVGEDVGSKVEVEKMKKTAQGQAQLLQLTAQQAQDDKKLDPKVAQALQNVISSYNAVA
ncbi:hypothetical protein EGQ24_02275 [bacterium]|nr:hypothetical protein [bacterium]